MIYSELTAYDKRYQLLCYLEYLFTRLYILACSL